MRYEDEHKRPRTKLAAKLRQKRLGKVKDKVQATVSAIQKRSHKIFAADPGQKITPKIAGRFGSIGNALSKALGMGGRNDRVVGAMGVPRRRRTGGYGDR